MIAICWFQQRRRHQNNENAENVSDDIGNQQSDPQEKISNKSKSSSDKFENDLNNKYDVNISGDISVKNNIDESDHTVSKKQKKKRKPPRLQKKISNRKANVYNDSDLEI